MTGHICITFTTIILGLHIYEYYSSNSSTSKHRPNTCHNFSLPPVDTRAWASDRQSGHVSHRRQCIHTDSLDMCVCSVVYALSRKFSLFLLSTRYYIVQYRRKNTFSCRCDCQLLCCHSVLLLWRFIFLHHVLQVFQSTFSPVTVQLRRAATELCNFDTKQSSLCCFDGFPTLYCCVNADVSS